MKKALALILTLIMVLGLMPAAMAATAPALQQQIGHYTPANDTDGTLGEPTESTPSEKTLEDGKVIISKNIAATQTENVFDITLTVKTTEEIKEVTSETADAAVVLVIDISNSMSDMANAQKAAQAFINSFAPAEGDTSTRKIAIVAFGTYAYQISGWVDASTLKTVSGEVHSTISGVKPNINEDTGGTNMHAGLLKASELLKDIDISSISNKNVLLFTDGVPTYHIKNNDELGGSGNIELLSQQIEHDNHAKVETTVRDNFSGIGKYAVYLGNERIYCESYRCPLYGSDGWFSYGGEAVKNWLKSLKSSDGTSFAAYSTSNASELANIFKSISELIKLKAQAWQLTDPMGDNIEFVQFLDANIDNKQATQSGGTISWDLKRDITKVHDDANKAYTYTLSYRIKLNTLSSGFAKDTFYKTNGVTDLTYFIEEQGTAGGLKHAYFNVPSVKGFAGDLTFTKVGANNEPLAGAAFKITANDDPNWSMDGTPSADGTSFTFTGIPSGHTYTLEETKTPEGYQGLDGTYTVEVAYGVAVLKKGTETVTAIVNTPKKTPTGSLTITKVFGEGSAFNTENWANATGIKQLTFTIVNEDGKTVETVTLPKNGQWTDTVELAPGTYTVTESDADVTGYGLTVSNTGTTTTTNGKTGTVTVTAGTTPATITFTNTYTLKTVNIPVTKVWNDNENEHPSVTAKLLADGKEVAGKTLTLGATATTGGDQWTGTFTNLPKYKDGNEITYTVIEDPVPAGYNSKVTGTVENGFTITNTKLAEGKTVVTVQKTWEAPDGTIFPEVSVNVLKDNEVVDTIKLNKDNGWMGSSKELDKYLGGAIVGDNPINYTVQEVVPDGYTASEPVYDGTEGVWQITNKIEKQYTVKLVKEVEGHDSPLSEVEVTVENKEGTYKKTHKVPVNGSTDIQVPAGTYTITENTTDIQVPGYTLNTTYAPNEFTVPADTADTADAAGIAATVIVTNTYEKIKADLVVYKNVTGNRGNYSSKAFTFRLTLTPFEVVAAGNVAQAPVNSAPPEINYSSPWYRIVRQDGTKEEGSVTVGMALEFNLGNGERLELYANGDRYDYEVKETNSLGHDTTVNGNDKGTIDVEKPTSVTFTNTKNYNPPYNPPVHQDPVPPIVIPPKPGDMTIWQSILHFLGIR